MKVAKLKKKKLKLRFFKFLMSYMLREEENYILELGSKLRKIRGGASSALRQGLAHWWA